MTAKGASAVMRWEDGSSVRLEAGSDCLLVQYATGSNEDRETHCDRIELHLSPCHFGGHRLYLVCPSCRKPRVSIYGSAPFACRECYDLAYASETTRGPFRLYDTGQKIAHKLAGRFVTLDEPFPDRPKGMHRKTYEAKRAKWKRMTNPARSIYEGQWSDEMLKEAGARYRANFDRQDERSRANVSAYLERYWQDKPTPANGLNRPAL
ncbi:hypothetical protein [Algimonas ampicilliniresistens]|nr:hypothetical protein [Algimonas ampicilliniresistens]